MKPFLVSGGLRLVAHVARTRWFERAEGRTDASKLSVLTYHRIASRDDPSVCPGLFSATPEELDAQLRQLLEHYVPVSVEEVLACQRGEGALPAGAMLVTFDDAYCDFEANAWPVLEALSIPSVVFVPTAYPDAPERAFWWDRLHAALATCKQGKTLETSQGTFCIEGSRDRSQTLSKLKALVKRLPAEESAALVDEVCSILGAPRPTARVLDWDALRGLARAGVAICAHTRTHPQLDRVSLDVARTEIRGSLDDLRRELGSVLPVFAYPDGAWSAGVRDVLAEEGVELAFTTRRGLNRIPFRAPLELDRVPINARTTAALLRAQLVFMRSWERRSA